MKTRAPPVVLLDEVVRMARQEVDKAGSQAEFARKAGVRGSSLNSTLTRKRPPTKDLLRALNLQKVFAYEALMKNRNAVTLGLDEVLGILREEVEKAGGQTEFARKTGVNRPNLNSTLLQKRPPTRDILKALNLRKTFGYEPVAKGRVIRA
jgi:DNA-binding phage protein